LVTITLTNQNTHAAIATVLIDITSKMCMLDNKQEIHLSRLRNAADFSHPLLEEPVNLAPNPTFHYEYSNVDALLHTAIYVYAILLRVDNPSLCKFTIKPSPQFPKAPSPETFYFSMDKKKKAAEQISLKQLESLVSQMTGLAFHFSEDVFINDTFTIDDLPTSIDGDALYYTDTHLISLLTSSASFRDYELRYITPDIGCGVFAKSRIKKGEIIGFYTGLKTAHKPLTLKYAFQNNSDLLHMYLDAIQHGNMTRFINHAPNHTSSPQQLSTANIEAVSYFLNGIEFILYSAKRKINDGEQLLVSYGKNFFQDIPIRYFRKNGELTKPNKNPWTNAGKKLNHIRIMANIGINQAQTYLLVRALIIGGTICLLLKLLVS
jgi:hypothetical protein